MVVHPADGTRARDRAGRAGACGASLAVLLVAGAATGTTACMSREREPATPSSVYDDLPPESSMQATYVGSPSQSTQPQYGATSAYAVQPSALGPSAAVYADDTDPTAIATFRPVLAPYGAWVEDPRLGLVWVPRTEVVGASFSPYLTAGHWSYTSEGYYWSSDYEWGWAPFHYGRWAWTEPHGWVWIAGARYSPAWVEWRYGSGYMGWGPAYPHYGWRSGTAVFITAGPTPYVFCPAHSFFSPQPSLVVTAPAAGPSLVAGTSPYFAPARPLVGARPFVGPDPKVVGIPTPTLARASISVPEHARPEAVPWRPAAASKIAPMAPGAGTSPSLTGVTPGGATPGPTRPGFTTRVVPSDTAMAARESGRAASPIDSAPRSASPVYGPSSPRAGSAGASGPTPIPFTGPTTAARAPSWVGGTPVVPRVAGPTYGTPTQIPPTYSPPAAGAYAPPTAVYSPRSPVYGPMPPVSPPGPTAVTPPAFRGGEYAPRPNGPSYSPPPVLAPPSGFVNPRPSYGPSYSPPPVLSPPSGFVNPRPSYGPSYSPPPVLSPPSGFTGGGSSYSRPSYSPPPAVAPRPASAPPVLFMPKAR